MKISFVKREKGLSFQLSRRYKMKGKEGGAVIVSAAEEINIFSAV